MQFFIDADSVGRQSGKHVLDTIFLLQRGHYYLFITNIRLCSSRAGCATKQH
jgi:hypothetical protein